MQNATSKLGAHCGGTCNKIALSLAAGPKTNPCKTQTFSHLGPLKMSASFALDVHMRILFLCVTNDENDGPREICVLIAVI